MLAYTARRLLIVLVTLLVASAIVFFVLEIVPGDPARLMLGLNATEDAVAALREQMGLNERVLTRYLSWLSGMARGDFGFIPVAEGDRLIGTITDRDIVVRAVAAGASPDSPVIEYISRDAQTVRDDADLKAVLDLMSSRQIRRAPVVDKHGRVVGVVSLGDLSTRVKEKYAGETLESISR